MACVVQRLESVYFDISGSSKPLKAALLDIMGPYGVKYAHEVNQRRTLGVWRVAVSGANAVAAVLLDM